MTDLAALYRQEAESVRRHCWLRVFGDWEDVAASVWLKALEAAARGHGPEPGTERGWLWSIVRSKLADYYRDKDKRRREQPLESIINAMPRSNRDLDNIEIRVDLIQVCQQTQLTEAEREVFDMRYIRGFRIREIAEMRGVNMNVIGACRMRGMRKMRTVAGRYHDE